MFSRGGGECGNVTEIRKFQWDEALRVGVESVDVQHQFFFSIVNQLADALRNGTGKEVVEEILSLLSLYSKWHFWREEECMARFQCPVAGINLEAHRVFLTKLASLQEQYAQSGGSHELALSIYEELGVWLVNHIMKIDSELSRVGKAPQSAS